MTNSPKIGNFELRTANTAAKTGVKGREAACAFKMDLTMRARPLIKFSVNNSTTIFLMLAVLTLLMSPFKLFLSSFKNSSQINGLREKLDEIYSTTSSRLSFYDMSNSKRVSIDVIYAFTR